MPRAQASGVKASEAACTTPPPQPPLPLVNSTTASARAAPAVAATTQVARKPSVSSSTQQTNNADLCTGVETACCMIRMKIQKLIPYFSKHIISLREKKDHDLDELEMQVVRYKPEGLDALCANTKFSRKELQIMYRGFKQECPTGIVNEETFKEIYAQFFPQGGEYSSAYAHYVFNTFDQDHNGTISFEEFVMGLSVLARGTFHEKLQWAFSLYDVNGDGIITKDEMLDIVSAIYDMMGKFAEPSIDEHTAKDHVERVFMRMDSNRDGVISAEEFMESCRKDDSVSKSLAMFDTVL